MTQVTLPTKKLERLLILNQIMLAVSEGTGDQNGTLLTTRIKGIVTPGMALTISAMIKDLDDLYVAHLANDLINSTSEVAEYLSELKSNSAVELETLQ